MTVESMGISQTQYKSVLKDIINIYEQSMNDGNDDWNKAILTSNWGIGKRIIKIKQMNSERAAYGDQVLKQLSKDLNKKYSKGFSERNLGYIRKFYLTYKSGQFHSELSWSHYLSLLLIDEETVRQRLEQFAIQKKLSSRDLIALVKYTISKTKNKTNTNSIDEPKIKTLTKPTLQLYTYRIKRKSGDELNNMIPHLDLGFSILLEEKKIAKYEIGSVIVSSKDSKVYSFKSNPNRKELYTYKAYLERVIDADTLLVTIDLGFSVSVKQRLRLRGLDAPELNTPSGIASKKFVEASLKDCKFLILKTHGKDKYDRYLVDVFYLKHEVDEEKVIHEGLFLNNELLSKNYAEMV
jgi:hypothetical protein